MMFLHGVCARAHVCVIGRPTSERGSFSLSPEIKPASHYQIVSKLVKDWILTSPPHFCKKRDSLTSCFVSRSFEQNILRNVPVCGRMLGPVSVRPDVSVFRTPTANLIPSTLGIPSQLYPEVWGFLFCVPSTGPELNLCLKPLWQF